MKRSWRRAVTLRLATYCEETSLHGLKYLVTGKNLFEKALWLAIALGFFCLAGYLCYKIFRQREESPVITTLDTTQFPVKGLEFPAVTICSPQSVVLEKFKLEACRMNFSTSDMIANIKNFFGIYQRPSEIESIQTNHSAHVIVELLKKAAPNCEDYLGVCQWDGEYVECNVAMTLVATDYGFCCSFNIEPAQEASVERLYRIDETVETAYYALIDSYQIQLGCGSMVYEVEKNESCPYMNSCMPHSDYSRDIMEYTCAGLAGQFGGPEGLALLPVEKRHGSKGGLKRVERAGKSYGLTFVFDSLRCEAVTRNDFGGVKVLVHHPREFPRVDEKGFAVSTGTETFVSVSAEVVETSAEVASVEPARRNCFLPGEKRLRHFASYSKPRCEIECEIPRMVEVCGCVPYYLPGGHPPCPGGGLAECARNASRDAEARRCKKEDCLPACDETIYQSSVSAGKFPLKEPNDTEILARMTEERPKDTLFGNKMYVESFLGLVHVYFKEEAVTKYSRGLRYSTIDLVSSVGGSVGLCLGFSLVSLLEVVYFAVVRRP